MTTTSKMDIAARLSVAHNKLLKIQEELNSEYFDRTEQINILLCAVLAQHHVLFVGDKGTGKTGLVKAFFRRVTGANLFMKTLAIDTAPSEVLGPFDLEELKHGRYHRNFVGFLPDADFSIIDEADKTTSQVLDAFLSAMNERIVEQRKTRTRTIVFACNELPDIHGPLFDRIGARIYCNQLDQTGYERMLDWHVGNFNAYAHDVTNRSEQAFEEAISRRLAMGESDNGLHPRQGETTISYEELELLMEARKHVLITTNVVAAIKKLTKDLADNKVTLSARRKGEPTLFFIQAAALLAGQPQARTEDLWPLKHMLWEDPEHRPLVLELVGKVAKPQIAQIKQIRDGILQTCETLLTEAREAKSSGAATMLMNQKTPAIIQTIEQIIQMIPHYHKLLNDTKTRSAAAGRESQLIMRDAQECIKTTIYPELANKAVNGTITEVEKVLYETLKAFMEVRSQLEAIVKRGGTGR